MNWFISSRIVIRIDSVNDIVYVLRKFGSVRLGSVDLVIVGMIVLVRFMMVLWLVVYMLFYGLD